VPRPPAICFVDLTGYTQLTEERGDEVAARVAGRLAWLVNDVARSRGGRPVRWLGDGGLFHLREPWMAVIAGLDMVECAPAVDLPPAHVGIHTGPVISQDGDVYGRTVNVAARIASYAQAGQVVVSEETAHRPTVTRCGSSRWERSTSRASPSPCPSLPSLPRGVRVGAAQTPGPLPRSWSGPPGRPAAHQGPMYQQDPFSRCGSWYLPLGRLVLGQHGSSSPAGQQARDVPGAGVAGGAGSLQTCAVGLTRDDR
jgi:hypothetical protein